MAISGPGFEYPNLKTQALLRRKRQEREEEIRRAERERFAKRLATRARELRMAGFGASAQELEDMAAEILEGK